MCNSSDEASNLFGGKQHICTGGSREELQLRGKRGGLNNEKGDEAFCSKSQRNGNECQGGMNRSCQDCWQRRREDFDSMEASFRRECCFSRTHKGHETIEA